MRGQRHSTFGVQRVFTTQCLCCSPSMETSGELTSATTEISGVDRARRLFRARARRGSVMHRDLPLPIRTNERGLSLVEVLVAATLVALAFIAVTSLFPTAYSNITYGGNETMAANYALQKIEQLKELSFNNIDANCSNVCQNLGNGFCRFCVLTTNVGVGTLSGDLKKVQVTVTWPNPGQYRPGTLSVETVFTR